MRTIRPLKRINKTVNKFLSPKAFNYSGLKSPDIGQPSVKKVSFRTRSVDPAPKENRID